MAEKTGKNQTEGAMLPGEGTRGPALHHVHPNNFDLIRLFAALQVVYAHGSAHLQVPYGVLGRRLHDLLTAFPGVPIFFVVSGFLISMSFERHPALGTYAQNRFLRIYPALWVAFLVGLILVAGTGFVRLSTLESPAFLGWVIAQLSVVQFYNPEFLRGFGVGVLNGSLWTIPVELGFYALLPLLYLGVLDRTSRRNGDVFLVLLALASFGIWFGIQPTPDRTARIVLRLAMVTVVPHLYMFLFGTLVQRHREHLRPLLAGRALLWAGLYVMAFFGGRAILPRTLIGNFAFDLLWQVMLAILVVSVAFTMRRSSDRLLRGNDVSYGVYLYHMLVVNLFVYLGWTGRIADLLVTFATTVALAVLSWKLVESPALRRKRSALHRVH